MAWKKGEATVLTTTLLIAVSVIASSFLVSIIQPQNYIPVADEPEILEKIDVVQVVRTSPSSILVGVSNTGEYDAIIDAIYVKDAQGALVRTFDVNMAASVGDVVNMNLPTTGQDTSNWIFFTTVTERGNSDTLAISNPVDQIPGYEINYYAGLVNVSFNGVPITNPTELQKLYDLDYEYLNVNTQLKTFEGTTVNPLANQSYSYDPATGQFNVVGSGGSAIHFIVKNNVATIILGGVMNLEGVLHQLRLNIVGDLPPGLGTYSVNLSWYNYIINRYSVPGEVGFTYANNVPLPSKKPNINITFLMGNAWEFVDPANGSWSIMLNFTLNGNPKNQKLDLANIRLTPIYIESIDGLFVYSIVQPDDLSKIQSINFDVTNQCNASSTPFLLKIFNYAQNSWDVLGTYTSSATPNTPTTFSVSLGTNMIQYIGADRRLMINFVPAAFIDGAVRVDFDQASLRVAYIN